MAKEISTTFVTPAEAPRPSRRQPMTTVRPGHLSLPDLIASVSWKKENTCQGRGPPGDVCGMYHLSGSEKGRAHLGSARGAGWSRDIWRRVSQLRPTLHGKHLPKGRSTLPAGERERQRERNHNSPLPLPSSGNSMLTS